MAQQIWQFETREALNCGAGGLPVGGPAFLTEKQILRMEGIRQARMLFRGQHRDYYLSEGRTQFNYPVEDINGKNHQPYHTLNILKLISKKMADLLFGAAPLVRVEDLAAQQQLSGMVDAMSLYELCKNSAVEASSEREVFWETVILNGRVYLRRVQNHLIHPEGDLQADGQYESYVQFLTDNLGTKQAPIPVLLETRWLAGAIERRLYQLDKSGNRVLELDLSLWPAFAASGIAPPARRETGIPMNTITWIPNDTYLDEAVSDYDGLVSPQDVLNAKWAQLNRVTHQNVDPKMAIPEEAAGNDGNTRMAKRAYYYDDPERIPKYITFDASLDAAIKEKSFALQTLLIMAEISPSLLGLKEGAAPDAWRKLKLEASNSIFMAARKAVTWTARIRRALSVCLMLDQTIPGHRYDLYPIAVQLQDGMPVDEEVQANVISVKRSAGIMSVRRGLEVDLNGDRGAVEKEMAELQAEAKAATPSFLLQQEPANPEGGSAGGREGGTAPAEAGTTN